MSSRRIMVAPLGHENTTTKNFYPLCVGKRERERDREGESDPRRTLLLGFAPIQLDLCISGRAGRTGEPDNTEPNRTEKETTEMSSSILGCGIWNPDAPVPAIRDRAVDARGIGSSTFEHLPIFVIYYRCCLVNSSL